MLEALAHNQLKQLLRGKKNSWPHNLTLSRLVARSLRRKDATSIQLGNGCDENWWIGLLLPLSISSSNVVLILSKKQRLRLLQVELPFLQSEGISLPIWEGQVPPSDNQVWILDHLGFLNAFKSGHLNSRQLIIPDSALLSEKLREVMAIKITSSDWDKLRRCHPVAESAIISEYEKLTKNLFSKAISKDEKISLPWPEIIALRQLINLLKPAPSPWSDLIELNDNLWVGWAELHHKTFNWTWQIMPLEPYVNLNKLFANIPTIFLSKGIKNELFKNQLGYSKCSLDVDVTLGGSIIEESISLFAPSMQPLPNSEIFSKHLLDQSLRLILGCEGLTVVLLDDSLLLQKLTTQLASEFGKRVIYESKTPEINGVLCCSWKWWLQFQDQLPVPEQLIIALLPIPSISSPLMSARVEALKKDGHDWFRDLLLPEAVRMIPPAISSIRKKQGRVAILDGRLRSRSWGETILKIMEPWTSLNRLLPK